LLQHVPIFLDHPQAATLFLAKITFLKYTHWLFSYFNLVLCQHIILYKLYVAECAPGYVCTVLCVVHNTARRTLSDVQLTQYDMLPQH